ncbi:caveolin-2 isoform X2 [Canis lupus baileyi]|uniref:caveolin-2 isoform X2 n=1 Tax=Canis lupus dingo TaxID=286419 RepID=UPI0003AE4F93|nr:caveolin-2 isoform X2 [Canis lupus dingo]XP_038541866.1 caveolin-2 isoform X1 [Canis lupus familiaris]|eukprot:XP_005628405.1 caveolin-2 isoform X1 [Canis lupus familiaris]
MGLETEKADVQLCMDDDAYSRHSAVDFGDLEQLADSGSDRDPRRLNSHLQDYNAFREDLPHGPAFGADHMEECNRCCHCPVVFKCRTQLLFCQLASESRLSTWTPGLESWIL